MKYWKRFRPGVTYTGEDIKDPPAIGKMAVNLLDEAMWNFKPNQHLIPRHSGF